LRDENSNLPESPNRNKAGEVKRPFLQGYPVGKKKFSQKLEGPSFHEIQLNKKNESSGVKDILKWNDYNNN